MPERVTGDTFREPRAATRFGGALNDRLVHLKARRRAKRDPGSGGAAGNTNCHRHSNGAFGNLRASSQKTGATRSRPFRPGGRSCCAAGFARSSSSFQKATAKRSRVSISNACPLHGARPAASNSSCRCTTSSARPPARQLQNRWIDKRAERNASKEPLIRGGLPWQVLCRSSAEAV